MRISIISPTTVAMSQHVIDSPLAIGLSRLPSLNLLTGILDKDYICRTANFFSSPKSFVMAVMTTTQRREGLHYEIGRACRFD